MFQLIILLGNEAMQDSEDVAVALNDVKNQIERGSREGDVRDSDGHIAGHYKVEYP